MIKKKLQITTPPFSGYDGGNKGKVAHNIAMGQGDSESSYK